MFGQILKLEHLNALKRLNIVNAVKTNISNYSFIPDQIMIGQKVFYSFQTLTNSLSSLNEMIKWRRDIPIHEFSFILNFISDKSLRFVSEFFIHFKRSFNIIAIFCKEDVNTSILDLFLY